MILLNYKEKCIEIVHEELSDDEDKDFCIDAVVAAIRWGCICSDGSGSSRTLDYLKHYQLTLLLEALLKSQVSLDKKVKIKMHSPDPKMKASDLQLGIAAAIRWYSFLLEEYKTDKDQDYLHQLGILLEQTITQIDVK